ncbi:adenosine deaminase [Devosia lucknowensis]|uniref:adenosine deaminase n=1 Tax=Devosia lucknowensis TaxID=1096929 RepID=A0A1Y6EHC4_9HYPH|nr:adenosine deaminase [Devosia lucknowensis]SMQ62028.1 adenosine deaminase [Devosia lucknowensis]
MTAPAPSPVADLPKVELHLHLDCSTSFQSVSALVPGMTLERYRADFLAPKKCVNLVDYFRYLAAPLALLQTERALRIATIDLLRQLADDNVVYAEIRFAPHLHQLEGLRTEQVVEIVLAALNEGKRLHPVEARLILCTLRPDDTAQGFEILALAEKYAEQGVGGIDLAGDEAGYGLAQHIPVFRRAADRGIRMTAHAGEATGAQSVREVISELGVRRVGHGVRSIEDPAVIDLILEHEVHLEVCPSCNIQIDVFPTYPDHPIDRLRRAGVSLSVNTDARGPTDLTLRAEYQRMHGVFGWEADDFRSANLDALAVSFLEPPQRRQIEGFLK